MTNVEINIVRDQEDNLKSLSILINATITECQLLRMSQTKNILPGDLNGLGYQENNVWRKYLVFLSSRLFINLAIRNVELLIKRFWALLSKIMFPKLDMSYIFIFDKIESRKIEKKNRNQEISASSLVARFYKTSLCQFFGQTYPPVDQSFFAHQPEISMALDFIFTLDTFIWKIIFLTRSSKLEKFDRVFLN